jgi:hypothetical protein
MADFTKLAEYLGSFNKEDQGYDVACYIKAKIAEDFKDRETINNGEEEELEDNDITMSTPEQQTNDNVEGNLMSSAFKEFDVLDKLKEEKEEIELPGKKDAKEDKVRDAATEQSFGDNIQNQKHASLFDALRNRLKK